MKTPERIVATALACLVIAACDAPGSGGRTHQPTRVESDASASGEVDASAPPLEEEEATETAVNDEDTVAAPDTNETDHQDTATGPDTDEMNDQDSLTVPQDTETLVQDIGVENDLAPACEADCRGRACGDDGCGGSCGTCGDTAVCNAETYACVEVGSPTCTAWPVLGGLTAEAAGSFYYDPIFGGSERLYVQSFSPELDVFDLASGVNANYATCEQCVLVVDDISAENPRYFFQTTGTMLVNDGSAPVGTPPTIDVQLIGVTLREVTLDPETWRSTLVPGGDCYTIPAAWLGTN